ncbi:MAG: hypothetical protein E6R12_12435 [Sphingomonadales bacterium]|nr:MAG: hypothetical protein E6R12_12435 [Sphingomonadales bacterium]
MVQWPDAGPTVVARFDFSDFEWSVIEHVFPTNIRGVNPVDHRQVLNTIFWRSRTGRGVFR